MTTRRTFLTAAGSVLISTAHGQSANAQQSLPVIGVLVHGTEAGFKTNDQAFREGLAKGGVEIGRNAVMVHAYTNGSVDRLVSLAADLVERKVAMIATTGDAATTAAKKATTAIPIVFSIGTDPVAQGLVNSLNRPGGNITGITNLNFELGQKRLEVMHEMVPKGARLALLFNPASSFAAEATRDVQSAAQRLGRELVLFEARDSAGIDAAFVRMRESQMGGVAINADAFFNSNSTRLAALALQHRLPAIYATREFTGAGGLVAYGNDLKDLFRTQGQYAARVLKGEKPADLPVQQAARIEMIVNLKTAAALGVTVPQHLLARADEVIE